jgi:hypothetical protein
MLPLYFLRKGGEEIEMGGKTCLCMIQVLCNAIIMNKRKYRLSGILLKKRIAIQMVEIMILALSVGTCAATVDNGGGTGDTCRDYTRFPAASTGEITARCPRSRTRTLVAPVGFSGLLLY